MNKKDKRLKELEWSDMMKSGLQASYVIGLLTMASLVFNILYATAILFVMYLVMNILFIRQIHKKKEMENDTEQ